MAKDSSHPEQCRSQQLCWEFAVRLGSPQTSGVLVVASPLSAVTQVVALYDCSGVWGENRGKRRLNSLSRNQKLSIRF